MSERFASKRDRWLILLGCGATVICVISLMPLLLANVDGFIKIIVAVVMVLTVGLVSWVLFGTYYVIDETVLRIWSGPFRWRIPLGDIKKVRPTRAPWSSPALSLDRLRIDYGEGKWILVSPERRNEFIRLLGRGGE